jgi:hypothetical protein
MILMFRGSDLKIYHQIVYHFLFCLITVLKKDIVIIPLDLIYAQSKQPPSGFFFKKILLAFFYGWGITLIKVRIKSHFFSNCLK